MFSSSPPARLFSKLPDRPFPKRSTQCGSHRGRHLLKGGRARIDYVKVPATWNLHQLHRFAHFFLPRDIVAAELHRHGIIVAAVFISLDAMNSGNGDVTVIAATTAGLGAGKPGEDDYRRTIRNRMNQALALCSAAPGDQTRCQQLRSISRWPRECTKNKTAVARQQPAQSMQGSDIASS